MGPGSNPAPVCEIQTLSNPTGCVTPGPNYAPNGEVFTPTGDLRVLVIYAGFGTFDGGQYLDEWPTSIGSTQLPNYVDAINGSSTDVFFNNLSDFSTICVPSNTTNKSISRFYYEMSKGNFRFMADVFKDPATGLPVRINIDPNGPGQWAGCNTRVMQKIQQDYPTFNWAPYDNRSNWPNFQCDNSASAPDMKPDYVVIIYRYAKWWSSQPAPGMDNWPGSGGGFSMLPFIGNINFNGYTFDGAGFTYCAGSGKPFGLFLHEVAHELYSSPHVFGNNGTIGNKFTVSNGWGMMTGTGLCLNECANGWERWLLGWTELQTGALAENSNINTAADLNATGEYDMRDYATTGDVIRIKIPNTTNDYVWLENHQKVSVFDHHPWAGQAPSTGGEQIADLEPGLYMYNETILGDRNLITTGLINNINAVNGIRTINAQGNYDYTHSAVAPPVNPVDYWNNTLFTFERTNSNPLDGVNPYVNFHDDYPSPPQNAGTNNGSITHSGGTNSGSYESYQIVRQTNGSSTNMLFSHLGGRNAEAIINFNRRSAAFVAGDEINMGTNPTITNFPYYNAFATPPNQPKLNPTVLSGLSIKVLSVSPTGVIRVKIEFGKPDVNDNVRWCGNIQLNNINTNGNSYDVNVKSGKTLTLDKSGVPNRHTTAPFINPTEMVCINNSMIHIESNSNFNIENGSTLRMQSGTSFIMESNSTLRVKTGSKLILEPNSALFNNGGKIIIEDGATLEYDRALVTLVTATSTLEIAGVLSLLTPTAPPNVFYFTGAGFIRFNNSTGTGNNIICGNDCNISLFGATNTQKVLEVLQPKLIIPTNLASLNFANGRYLLQGGAAIQALGVNTVTETHYATFTSTNGVYNSHKGFWLNGQQASFYYSNFSCGVYGIYNNQTAGGNSMYLSHCYFTNNG